MSRRQLRIQGVEMGVEERGGGPNSRGTLVLLHGFTGSAASWGNLLDELAEDGYRVIALDLLGHGTSTAPRDPGRYTMFHAQQDILTALQQLGVQAGKAILLGYSMGGRVALYISYSYYFRALILESASPGLAETHEREQRKKSDYALAEHIENVGVEEFVAYWENLPLFASQKNLPVERWEAQRRQRLNNRSLGLANSLRGLGTGEQPPLHEQLNRLDLPVLLLAGELDDKFCGIAREMAEHLPQSQLKIIPEAGHTLHLERPEQFKEAVLTFCTDMLP